MAEYALTGIKHGKEDGETVLYDEGDEIDTSDFTEDELKTLRETGAVGQLEVTPEQAAKDREELLTRIAELEAELAAKRGQQTVKPAERASVDTGSTDEGNPPVPSKTTVPPAKKTASSKE